MVTQATHAKARSEASDRRWQSYLSPDSPSDPYAVEGAFELIQTYSLIQWRDERGGYAMHELVHACGQDRLGMKQQRHLSLMALELLTDIYSLYGGQSDLRSAARPTCDGELCRRFWHKCSIGDHR
jgi:hypothetical protein